MATSVFAATTGLSVAFKTKLDEKYPTLPIYATIGILYGLYDHYGDALLYRNQKDKMTNNIFWRLHPSIALDVINKDGHNTTMTVAFKLFYLIANNVFSFGVEYVSNQLLFKEKRIDEKKRKMLKYVYYGVALPLLILGEIGCERRSEQWEYWHPILHIVHHVINLVKFKIRSGQASAGLENALHRFFMVGLFRRF
eukprot:898921_1